MDKKAIEKFEGLDVDVRRLFQVLLKKSWLIALAAVLCAAAVFAVSFFLITPKYESSVMFYVNNNAVSGESITSSDITASKSLVDSYIVILNTRETLNEVIRHAGLSCSCDTLEKMISAESVNSTEIFEVTVTSTSPHQAQLIAEAIGKVIPDRIANIIEGTSAKVMDSPTLSTSPSSPKYIINTVLGFLVGMVLTVSVLVIREVFDVTIRSEEDVTNIYNLPVLAAVPDMESSSKNSYYYGSRNKDRKKNGINKKQHSLVGSNISFAATESYKLLRTMLQFSFADENTSRVIGISSALSGEGKSLTAINLAYSLSQLDKKVLLIDCDMRRPTVSIKLPVNKVPGLSNYLAGQVDMDKLFQKCGLENEEDAFTVISAGRNPPNSVELLSSGKMYKLLKSLRKVYDYILLDFPPVGEVSDALATAKGTDGILLVVRQNYCNRLAFASTMEQFEYIGCKLLGVVYNCASENNNRAYSKKYYKHYQNSAHGRYAKAVAHKHSSTSRPTPPPKKEQSSDLPK